MGHYDLTATLCIDKLQGDVHPQSQPTLVRRLDMLRSEAHIATERARDYLDKLCRHIQRIAQKFFDQKQIALTVLGNLDGFKIGREDLAC